MEHNTFYIGIYIVIDYSIVYKYDKNKWVCVLQLTNYTKNEPFVGMCIVYFYNLQQINITYY